VSLVAWGSFKITATMLITGFLIHFKRFMSLQ